MILRSYQLSAVEQCLARLQANPCLVAPTGSGKTTMGAEIVRRRGAPTLWLAHRRELIQQAAARLRQEGLQVGTIMASEVWLRRLPVQVASVQTLLRRTLPPAELIVIDEAHHSVSPTFRQIIEQYGGVPRLGLTATPFRLSGEGLGDLFGELVVAAHADDLCRDGTLVEPRVYAPAPPDLRGVHVAAGDYKRNELGAAMDKPKLVADVVQTWLKHAAGRRTVLFAVNVEHSQHLIAAFVAAGIPAEHIDGKTPKPDRAAALARLADGKTLVMSNCQVLTEGWDLPSLECAIGARPTASLCLHLQMVGRIMRSCPGKDGAIVLDHAGNFLRHGRVTQRIEYSLAGRIPQAAAGGTGLRTCPACYRMVLASRTACPECGLVFPVRERELPQHEEGELVELTADQEHRLAMATAEQQEQAWREWMAEVDRGTRTLAGAQGAYKARFGTWPMLLDFNGAKRLVTRAADPDLREAVYEHFQQIEEERGYAPKYAQMRCKELFGVWMHGRKMVMA